MIKELVTYLVQQLVLDPKAVQVELIKEGETETLLEIKVAPGDRGRVIGRGGMTIKALRALVDVLVPRDKKVSLQLAQ